MLLRSPSRFVALLAVLLAAPLSSHALMAQAPTTGTCKDGTTTSAKTRSGACRSHGGVATWTGSAAKSDESAGTTTTTATKSSKQHKQESSDTAATAAASTRSSKKHKKDSADTAATASASSKSSKKHKKDKDADASPTSAAALTPANSTSPTGSGFPCTDGTISHSKSRSGACRGHGGIEKATAKAPASSQSAASTSSSPLTPASAGASTSSPAPTKPTASATPAKADEKSPEGATASCKDGTYSHSKHHTGACAHHGGVAQWLDKTGT